MNSILPSNWPMAKQEIAQKLGDPLGLAAQFDGQPSRQGQGRGRGAAIAGMCLAAVPVGAFFLLLAGWGILVACFSLASLTLGVCLIAGLSPLGLIMPMPHGISAVFGIALAALSVLSAAGCVYFTAFFRQLLRSCRRCFKNAVSISPPLPPIPAFPTFSPGRRRVLRRVALVSLCVFAALTVLGMAPSMAASGSLGFWHAWGWFGHAA